MNITSILQAVTVGSAVLMMISILLQQRGASLGAGFGTQSQSFHRLLLSQSG